MKGKKWWECSLPAACICDTLTLNGFTDWYLPSINELKGMYDNQKLIGNFTVGDYCSSTEKSNIRCWNVHFRPQRKIIFPQRKTIYDDSKVTIHYFVRCIRRF